MAIKVIIRRHIKENKLQEAFQLLRKFRTEALHQSGYISGETLVNHHDSRSLTIISTWHAVDDWVQWQESDVRRANEAKLSELQEVPTKYEIYDIAKFPFAS